MTRTFNQSALKQQMQAEIERLRDALKTCRELLRAALKTCRELREWHRNAVIEECAKVAETHPPIEGKLWIGDDVAAAIRALKEKS